MHARVPVLLELRLPVRARVQCAATTAELVGVAQGALLARGRRRRRAALTAASRVQLHAGGHHLRL